MGIGVLSVIAGKAAVSSCFGNFDSKVSIASFFAATGTTGTKGSLIFVSVTGMLGIGEVLTSLTIIAFPDFLLTL
ncbi:MAG: hypothetical protein ACD_79C00366G0002 [uncultured bacterium]|nr:MAG: hypothetical protein ACD_79C00366G0002 [uncultured bacterium]